MKLTNSEKMIKFLIRSSISILCKINNKILYFGDMSNLHGVGYVFSMSYIPYFKRFFWCTILSMCCYGAWMILQSSLGLFSTSTASYAVETNYLEWNTPFPAVTVCEQNDNGGVKEYLKKEINPMPHSMKDWEKVIERRMRQESEALQVYFRHNLSTAMESFFKDVSFWNIQYCRSCTTCKMNDICVENFTDAIPKIRQECHELFTECSFGNNYFRCCDKFYSIETEYGSCFVFNSELVSNTSTQTVNRSVGLPDLVFYIKKVMEVRIHAPDDIVSVLMTNLLHHYSSLPLVTDLEAILRVEQTINDASVKTLPESMRGCLFKEERPFPDWPFKEYTQSACFVYCKALAQRNICNCTHHFLANMAKRRVCDVKGMTCLYENRNTILNNARDYSLCPCPVACDETVYEVVHIFSKRVSIKMTDKQKLGSRVKISLANLPTVRSKRLAIKDPLGLVVDIGGVGGVFFGASLLSIIELIYLFCIRRE